MWRGAKLYFLMLRRMHRPSTFRHLSRCVTRGPDFFHLSFYSFLVSANDDAVSWREEVRFNPLSMANVVKTDKGHIRNVQGMKSLSRDHVNATLRMSSESGTSRFSANISRLFQDMWLANYVLTIFKSNWNQWFEYWKKKLKVCSQVLTSFTQQHNRSFHFEYGTTMEFKN